MSDTPPTEAIDSIQPAQPGDVAEAEAPTDERETARRAMTSDDFLVPGPTPTSNAGLRRWGCSWLAFSVALMLLMLGMAYLCWLLAHVTGAA